MSGDRPGIRAAAVIAVALAAAGAACSPQKMALNRMATALSEASSVYESDNDPEFVRLAAPSTLKTVEMLLSQDPNHQGLLLTACRGFTEYSYGFLHVESELRASDRTVAQDLKVRAERMYERARGYCLRGLQLRHPGLTLAALQKDPSAALGVTTKDDVPLLYWTGTSWGADIAVSPAQFARVAELVPIRALLLRAKGLDAGWDHGAIYETLIVLDGLPALVGGSAAAAKSDFDKAMELSDGQSVFARVAYAATLTNQTEKRQLLQQAVEVDVSKSPSRRLTNLIAQRYAKALLGGAH
jgi:TRAP transporter TatT component family protein